ncbi:MAG: transposase [Treponema sp.]|nr:transposase [Treponema sp.]
MPSDTEGDAFNKSGREFANVDFNEARLERRFRRTMETLAKNPRKSIYGGGANRAEAKTIYNLLGNDKFNKSEIPRGIIVPRQFGV